MKNVLLSYRLPPRISGILGNSPQRIVPSPKPGPESNPKLGSPFLDSLKSHDISHHQGHVGVVHHVLGEHHQTHFYGVLVIVSGPVW